MRAVAALALVALLGCQSGSANLDRDGDGVTRVACLGDSNTTDAEHPSWCNLLGEEFPAWVMSNRSWAGMTIIDTGATYGGFVLAARPHVDEVLTIDHADVVILAFGTNDFFRGATSTPTPRRRPRSSGRGRAVSSRSRPRRSRRSRRA